MKKLLSMLFIFVIMTFAQNNKNFLTVAEKSNYESTSRYSDVLSFIHQLKKLSPFIKVENIARSTENYDIPMIMLANPMPKNPSDLKNDKRLVVYFQANIHAGEVEGKEAVLMLARDILSDKKSPILKDIILIITPNYNPDGNEKISTENRKHQNGPKNGVGLRHNGLMLDLNRDAMKAESPETRGLLNSIINKWDPSVIVDCHTTNGSYHVEPITFTWQMNPNGSRALINYMRDKFAPTVRTTLKNKYNTLSCFYGEFLDMMNPEKGWESYAFEPRYFVNYMGLRNRLSILIENYVYADFKSRVESCYFLLKSIIDYSIENKLEIQTIIKETDFATIQKGLNPQPADSFAVEFTCNPTPAKVDIKTYKAELLKNPQGFERYRKTDEQINVSVPYFADYFPKKNVKYPYAYLLTITDPEILNLFKIHGIEIEKLSNKTEIEVETFKISELKPSERINQGHYNNIIKGDFVKTKKTFEAGTLVIRAAQKLAPVAAYLLEPLTDDGLVKWNFFDRYLVPQWGRYFNEYPVFKVINKTEIKSLK